MLRKKLTLFSILMAGSCLIGGIALTGPKPLEATKPPVTPQVTVVAIPRAQEPITITAVGSLIPRQTLALTTQVPGELTWVSSSLDAGRSVAAGEKLLQIEERDYAIALASAQARLAQAEANIALEQGRAEIARLEWRAWQTSGEVAEEASPLALRAPQRAEAVARRRVIEAELRNARLALKRTSIHAPWPATVAQANAVVGQVLAVGAITAVLLPLDFGIVELQLPVHTAGLLEDGIRTIELVPLDNPDAEPVVGTFEAIVRNLTNDTRLATVRVRIDEPLNNQGWTYGMHLRAQLVATKTRTVAQVPANLMVNGNLIWIYRNGLAIRHRLKPTGGSGNLVSVEDSFDVLDQLITDRPIGLLDGMPVELKGG